MDATNHAAESALATGSKITSAMTQGGAAATIFAGLSAQDAAIVVGMAVSIIGLAGNLAINWYWKARQFHFFREKAEWDRRRFDVAVERERRGGQNVAE